MTFDNFFECEFYKKYKKKIYINYKKIINSNVLKECIKKINSECPEYFIHKLTKYFEISDVIEKNIDIYPFDTQIGITDKYTMKIYLKGIISINKLDSYNIDYNNLLENLYNDSYFNLIFIHEFCGHFIRVYIYYMLNNEYFFYTPRLNINKKYIQESGKQLEFLLFDHEIVFIKFPEIIYIININNYLKKNVVEFNNEFSDQEFLYNSVKDYKGEYEKDINKINELNQYIYKKNRYFSLKKNIDIFEIGVCGNFYGN